MGFGSLTESFVACCSTEEEAATKTMSGQLARHPTKPDLVEPSSRPEALPVSMSDGTDSVTTTNTAGALHDAIQGIRSSGPTNQIAGIIGRG